LAACFNVRNYGVFVVCAVGRAGQMFVFIKEARTVARNGTHHQRAHVNQMWHVNLLITVNDTVRMREDTNQ